MTHDERKALLKEIIARMNERAKHPLRPHTSTYWHSQPKAGKAAA